VVFEFEPGFSTRPAAYPDKPSNSMSCQRIRATFGRRGKEKYESPPANHLDRSGFFWSARTIDYMRLEKARAAADVDAVLEARRVNIGPRHGPRRPKPAAAIEFSTPVTEFG
jgi:hypothetical protein